jgi:deferrochelatase/peroxidase EfeB
VPGDGPKLTRGRLLASAGGAALAAAAGGAGFELGRDTDASAASSPVPFYGEHQAGIATPAQDRLVFGAFDLTLDRASELHDLLRTWTEAAARLTVAKTIGGSEPPAAPPLDTGEAVGLAPARLTITFGLGATVFELGGSDRFGLAARRPSKLLPLGPLPGELLDPASSDGDLCIQACADDPQVAFHAVRNLARLARGAAQLRWLQLGFGRTSSTTKSQRTPRNSRASRTAPTTSRPTTTRRWPSTSGSGGTSPRAGCMAGPISSHGGSACSSRRGTARASTTSSSRSGASRRAARR